MINTIGSHYLTDFLYNGMVLHMKPFLEALAERVLIQDGAKGTMLFARGWPAEKLPDLCNVDRPDDVRAVHRAYAAVGCDILSTNTFSSIRPTLEEHGLADRLADLNRRGVELAREAANGQAYVAATIPPISHFLKPRGPLSFDQAIEIYREQVAILEEASVDLYKLETASDLREVKAALLAIRSLSHRPIVAMMSFNKDGRTLLGTTPEAAAIVLSAMGADVIGVNCSVGVAEIYQSLLAMSQVSQLPKCSQPNGGLPSEQDHRLIYPLGPEIFADYVERLVEVGAGILGGCCGTTPDHIRAMREQLARLGTAGRPRYHVPPETGETTWLCSSTTHLSIGGTHPFAWIGERINPTRRKGLRAALLTSDLGPILREAEEQTRLGAMALDVNVGVGPEESGALMASVVRALEDMPAPPLVLDSADPAVLEVGLRAATGKVLINSVSAEPARLARLLPLVKQYGAAVIGLCVDENGVPEKASGRVAAAERILTAASQHGIARCDVVIDPGVVSVAAAPDQPVQILTALSQIKKRLKANTCLGLSNISHGMPDRPALNAAFLAMALSAGLDAAIFDPGQPEVRRAARGGALLSGRDPGATEYLKTDESRLTVPSALPRNSQKTSAHEVTDLTAALLRGDRNGLLTKLTGALDACPPGTIENEARRLLNEQLIPAMDELGRRFKAKELFLPHLMAAAETMQAAVALIEPRLSTKQAAAGPLLVFATVEGDVHDIGKNIVKAMLQAAGFRVRDLGKSIPAATIVQAVREHNAALVCLSALMTTTMRRMEEVVTLLRIEGHSLPVLVGGAVVTEGFARSIGAAYAEDAIRAVDMVRKLLP
jgi:5-methyltetrahydrofolate--homocysteine methyltransferase